MIVGAHYYNGDLADEGKAYVYYGGGGAGITLRPRQVRADGSALMGQFGKSNSMTSARLSMNGRTPMGRQKVKVQWQVAPIGVSLGALSTVSGASLSWTDVLTGGVGITETVTGLTAGTPYHWRARLLYKPGNSLGLVSSRWISANGNGGAEQDLLTPYQAIAGLSAVNNGPTNVGNATSLTVNISAGTRIYYSWNFGDGTTGSGATVNHTYSTVGSYAAVVTATNPLGSSTTSTNVTLVSRPTGVSIDGENTGRLLISYPFAASVSPDSANLSVNYTWEATDQTTVMRSGGLSDTQSFSWNTEGTKTITVTATNDWGSTSSTHTIVINPFTQYLPLVVRSYSGGW